MSKKFDIDEFRKNWMSMNLDELMQVAFEYGLDMTKERFSVPEGCENLPAVKIVGAIRCAQVSMAQLKVYAEINTEDSLLTLLAMTRQIKSPRIQYAVLQNIANSVSYRSGYLPKGSKLPSLACRMCANHSYKTTQDLERYLRVADEAECAVIFADIEKQARKELQELSSATVVDIKKIKTICDTVKSAAEHVYGTKSPKAQEIATQYTYDHFALQKDAEKYVSSLPDAFQRILKNAQTEVEEVKRQYTALQNNANAAHDAAEKEKAQMREELEATKQELAETQDALAKLMVETYKMRASLFSRHVNATKATAIAVRKQFSARKK
ncbi:MAG: hypothetical protein IKK76_00355 [Alphaproteobacteria bacterium]|nr:hypothetical protein [Alphaproteobacteria bacterium]